MSLGKKILIIALSIISVVAIVLDCTYYYVLKNAPDKKVSQTFYIGGQVIKKVDEETGEVSTERKPFIELNVYDNVFEVVFNMVSDENQESFYSKAVQYVANSGNLDFDLKYSKLSEKTEYSSSWVREVAGRTYSHYYNAVYRNSSFKNLTAYQYASADGFESTLNNDLANPLNNDTFFKIQIGSSTNKKMYGLTLKNTKTYYDNEGGIRKDLSDEYLYQNNVFFDYYLKHWPFVTHLHYSYCDLYIPIDFNYLVCALYNSVRGVAKGTSQEFVLQFDDYFDYWEFDEKNSVYNMVTEQDKMTKISAEVSTYCLLKVNVHDGVMKYSSQSLTNMLMGTANYIEPSSDDEPYYEYLYGKTVVKARYNKTFKDFELVPTAYAGVYKFRLKQEFKDYYAAFANDIIIELDFDTDYLSSVGIEFYGVETGTFGNFTVREGDYYVA